MSSVTAVKVGAMHTIVLPGTMHIRVSSMHEAMEPHENTSMSGVMSKMGAKRSRKALTSAASVSGYSARSRRAISGIETGGVP